MPCGLIWRDKSAGWAFGIGWAFWARNIACEYNRHGKWQTRDAGAGGCPVYLLARRPGGVRFAVCSGVALGVGDVGISVSVSIRNYMKLSSLNPTKQGQIRQKERYSARAGGHGPRGVPR